eukprot:GHRR01032999.1.p2 GENE.GHRR01032999.1~~GHRR01032999.1.p2  ORF type:complete len:125 (+),score=18.84 GHRR01032999.1:1082-1456(+)
MLLALPSPAGGKYAHPAPPNVLTCQTRPLQNLLLWAHWPAGDARQVQPAIAWIYWIKLQDCLLLLYLAGGMLLALPSPAGGKYAHPAPPNVLTCQTRPLQNLLLWAHWPAGDARQVQPTVGGLA